MAILFILIDLCLEHLNLCISGFALKACLTPIPDETLFLQRLKLDGLSVVRISFSTSPCEMPNCSLMMSKVVLSSQAISTILSFSKSLKYFKFSSLYCILSFVSIKHSHLRVKLVSSSGNRTQEQINAGKNNSIESTETII